MIVYEPKVQPPCTRCGGKLTRSGDCEDCDDVGTGCDDLSCAHDHCNKCGALLNTANCGADEEEHAREPHPSVAGLCLRCGKAA